jgi:hypothetical protein
MLYLVNSGDDKLLLVARYRAPEFALWWDPPHPSLYFKTSLFEVFRMNWGGLHWDRVVNLGDRLSFVGENSLVSLSAFDVQERIRNRRFLGGYNCFGQCLENCIYFIDDHRVFNYDGAVDLDRGIYMLCDESIIETSEFTDDLMIHFDSSMLSLLFLQDL